MRMRLFKAFVLFGLMLTTAVGEETTAAAAETTAAAEGETTAADATTAAAEGSGSGGEAVAATTAASKPKVVIKLPVTTTLPPPAVCKCLGDDELLADVDMSTKILTTCLDFKQRVTSDGMGNIAEKYRCGTRTPDNPTKDEDSICFCMEKEEKVKHFHWVMLELRDMNARHRWNTYDYISKRLPFNYLQEPKSKIYIDLKEDIEEIFNTIMINTAGARDKGFVRTALMRFNKGSGCIECPTSTTTTTTTTTTTQNITTMETTAAPAAGGGAGGAEGSGGGAGEEAATTEAATTAAEGARKRRNAETTTVATTTTTQIVYDSYYVQAFLEFQFMKEIDAASFETMFEGILDSGTEGFNLTHMNASYPEKNTCGNKDLTDLLPTHMKSMKHDKEMSFINVTQKYPNGTLKTDDQGNTKYVWLNKTHIAQEDIIRLSVGEDVNLECKDPLSKPSADQYDLDPYDGIITAVCQPDEAYSVRVTQLAVCKVVCSQAKIPVPDLKSGLVFEGISRPGAFKLKKSIDMDPREYIFSGDKIVYKCKEKNYGIEGGADVTLDRYSCTDSADFDAAGPQNWPVCRPQSYMIEQAVEIMLDRYTERIENRYKLIKYQEEDGEKTIQENDHILTVTIPTVIGMIVVIMITLLCSRNNSPVCSICASKS